MYKKMIALLIFIFSPIITCHVLDKDSTNSIQANSQIKLNVALGGYYEEKMTDSLDIKNENVRHFFLSAGIGILEVGTIGIGYQINEDFSIGIIGGATWIGSANYNIPNGASGYGIRFSYYKKILFFNNLSFDYIPYLASTLDWESLGYNPTIKGHYWELNLGKQNIYTGFKFYWAFGVGISSAKESHLLIFPSLKIGTNFNF